MPVLLAYRRCAIIPVFMKALLLTMRREFWVLFFILLGIVLSAVAATKISEPVTAQWYWFAGMSVALFGLLLPNLNKKALAHYLHVVSRVENWLIPLLL